MSCYLVVSKLWFYTALNTPRYTSNHCPNPPAMRQFRVALPDFVANRATCRYKLIIFTTIFLS